MRLKQEGTKSVNSVSKDVSKLAGEGEAHQSKSNTISCLPTAGKGEGAVFILVQLLVYRCMEVWMMRGKKRQRGPRVG